MHDPPTAFRETQRGKARKEITQPPQNINPNEDGSSQLRKAVTFKEAPQRQQQQQQQQRQQVQYQKQGQRTQQTQSYGRVEELQTLLRDARKNEKRDFSNRCRNVPSVWLNRIPYAGMKNAAHEDIREVFNH